MKKLLGVIRLLCPLLLLPGFFSQGFLMAESQYPPTQYNTYDGFAPGAKALSMGLAFTSVADDPSAIYFNPAGLEKQGGGFISFSMDGGRMSELTKDQIFANEPIRNSGLTFLALSSGKGSFSFRPIADETIREVNGNDWKSTEIKINAYTVSAAHKNDSGITTGLNMTYLSGRISQAQVQNNVPSANLSSGNGMSFDFGFLCDVSQEFAFGINFQNIFGMIWWDDYEKDQLPFCLRGGVAFKIPGYSTFAAELEKKYYRSEHPGPDETITHFGFEQTLTRAIKIRAGAYGPDFNDKDKLRVTYGLGYELKNYRLSFASEKYRISGIDVDRYVFGFDIPI